MPHWGKLFRAPIRAHLCCMLGFKLNGPGFPLATVAAICMTLTACMEKAENSPDRQQGPPGAMQGHTAKEGAPDGRGISPVTGPPQSINQPPLATPDEIVRQTNVSALIGQQVQWRNVTVQKVLSDQYVLVGTDSGTGVLVRLKELITGLQPGQRLNISGMVAQLGVDLSHWELNPEQKQLIQRTPVFVNAFQSEKSNAP
jgi:hypothetical protein